MACKSCHPQVLIGKPRKLFLDTEVSASFGAYYPPRYDTNILWTVSEWKFLCFSYAWDDGKIINVQSWDEKKLVKELWKLLDGCDLLVCHNISFDQGKAYAKFLEYHLPPPRPFKTFCTLRKYRSLAKMESNKLGDLGEKLGFGDKIDIEGKRFWRKVLAKDTKSVKQMITYCSRDVWLLRKIYHAIQPFFPEIKLKCVKRDASTTHHKLMSK